MKKHLLLSALLPALLAAALFADMPSSSFMIVPESLGSDVFSRRELRFSITSSDADFSLPPTSTQKIVSESEIAGGKEIVVATGDYGIAADEPVAKYLKDTPYLNLESREIKGTAAKFRNSKDPVKDISLFVYRHITDKKEGIPIIPALSILKDRTGDCTEHSILTVSLLRARKIPARAVVGVILSEYYGGRKNVFVYHMWVEACINGRWTLVDSTRPMSLNHGRYIAFTYHNLKTESPIDYLNAISAINNVRIREAD